jgi:hypothetical protein
LTLYAAYRVGAPRLLIALFAMWVVSPFVLLAAGHVLSRRWSLLIQAAVHGVTVLVAAASLTVYGVVALGAARPKTAVFVIVAPASWLLVATVVGTAALMALISKQRGNMLSIIVAF